MQLYFGIPLLAIAFAAFNIGMFGPVWIAWKALAFGSAAWVGIGLLILVVFCLVNVIFFLVSGPERHRLRRRR